MRFLMSAHSWHLRSVINRLDQYLDEPLQRIGLSATVSNPDQLLSWLAPQGERTVVGSASVSTDAEVTIDHVGSLDNAATVIARLHQGQKRLVFCDSRSSAERLSSMLREHSVRTFVSHASLSLAERRQAEAAFAEERDCVIVATSTLELGIDVGDLDRVIQIDSPSSVSSFLQRMGRTGRRPGARRNCLFLTTSDNAFLLAMGVTRRWSEGWVEAAMPPPEPWHIAAQQALVTSLERGDVAEADLIKLLEGSFPELRRSDLQRLLEHLVEHQYLAGYEGVLRVGAATERAFAQGHYRDLLASFSGAQLLTGRHGAAEVGYIDPGVLTGEREERLVLLAGRSWRVTSVDWAKRIVWMEPAPAGGKARWMGGARSVSRDVCQGIRAALAEGPPTAVTLSRRAGIALAALTDDIPVPADGGLVVSREEGAPVRTWTFAGTRANRTLARQASEGFGKVRFDALSVQAPIVGVVADPAEPLALTAGEIAEFRAGVKFSECVPPELLARTIGAREFETAQNGG